MIFPIITQGFFLALLAFGFTACQAASEEDTAQSPKLVLPAVAIEPQHIVANHPKRANFKRENPSHAARYIADWVVDSGDNSSMPFVIIDKANAKVFVFYADGNLRGTARALLGLARGDDTVPGIGRRVMSKIRPDERTTPAGRFVSALGHNLRGEEILWVDYDAAIAMHPVITTNAKEHRLRRLGTATNIDKRISYGCINVPAKFYEEIVHPAFTGTNGVVYVLPEIKSASEVFGSYNVDDHIQKISENQPTSTHIDSASLLMAHIQN